MALREPALRSRTEGMRGARVAPHNEDAPRGLRPVGSPVREARPARPLGDHRSHRRGFVCSPTNVVLLWRAIAFGRSRHEVPDARRWGRIPARGARWVEAPGCEI